MSDAWGGVWGISWGISWNIAEVLVVAPGKWHQRTELPKPKHVKVESSNIKSIFYNKDTAELRVKFNYGNQEYSYANVPSKAHSKLMNAASKGKHFHNKLEGKYIYNKITRK